MATGIFAIMEYVMINYDTKEVFMDNGEALYLSDNIMMLKHYIEVGLCDDEEACLLKLRWM